MTQPSIRQGVFRHDYRAPEFLIPETELFISLDAQATTVTGRFRVERNGESSLLVLHRGPMQVLRVALDGENVVQSRLSVTDDEIRIEDFPLSGVLEIEAVINPFANLALEGLYLSGGIFCTQNEPEGFRRIIPFIDRPDNMTRFTVTIEGNREECPIMLSNGNKIEEGLRDGGRHYVVWRDPFPKPVYLFALVAGKLGVIQDTYTTRSGRDVLLQIFSDPGYEEKCRHALASLKKAFAWDEKRFGLEYDLDTYMIVAVNSFNMGAMENKGLNIFNAQYILADPESATDANFEDIEAVVAHEYFHNWTGNRVTCRDWFQLTLKEGLTVFRDQEFTADLHSRAVKRIEDVAALRSRQFPEDSGPMSHPIRPDSYLEVNNFYTVTVYEKGAEVIRMIHTILGETRFMEGMARYIGRFDGMAVTCDDFVDAMEEGSGEDFSLFRNWYSQSGTPVITVTTDYDATAKKYAVRFSQSTPPTADQKNKGLLDIPLSLSLIDRSGRPLQGTGQLFRLKESEAILEFRDIEEPPVLSVNRSFSAPVIIKNAGTFDDDLFLFSHDDDPFNRYDAGQRVFHKIIEDTVRSSRIGELPGQLTGTLAAILGEIDDPMYLSYLFSLPSLEIIAEAFPVINIQAIHGARQELKKDIARAILEPARERYLACRGELGSLGYAIDQRQTGLREFSLTLLSYLVAAGGAGEFELARAHFRSASTMTDSIGALAVMVHHDPDSSAGELADFYESWSSNQLVINKWFSIQATIPRETTLELVTSLEADPVFDRNIPNMVRALYRSYSSSPVAFHRADGEGYRFIADKILELDPVNPSMASSLAGAFRYYGRLPRELNLFIKRELNRLMTEATLSKNTFEVISKTMAAHQ